MTIVQQAEVQDGQAQQDSAFAAELRARVAAAVSALEAAEAQGDPLLAQIAESDLADLRALAARNDIPTG